MTPREKFLCETLALATDQITLLSEVVRAYDELLTPGRADELLKSTENYRRAVTGALDMVGFNPYEKEKVR